jgi:hypothetical protein
MEKRYSTDERSFISVALFLLLSRPLADSYFTCCFSSSRSRSSSLTITITITTTSNKLQGSTKKFAYFLAAFHAVLLDPYAAALQPLYAEEYLRVVDEYTVLHRQSTGHAHHTCSNGSSPRNNANSSINSSNKNKSHPNNTSTLTKATNSNGNTSTYSITKHDTLGMVVVTSPAPLHYYSLFSASAGCDIVVSVYADRRYEVEQKVRML